MTSDDSNNNWSGSGPTDPSPGAADPAASSDVSPTQPSDRGGEAAGERAASEPARTHEGQAEGGGSRSADESARTFDRQEPGSGYRSADERTWPQDRQAPGGGYRAPDDASRPAPGWQPGPQPDGAYPPRADQQHGHYAGHPHEPHGGQQHGQSGSQPYGQNQGGYYPPPQGPSYSQHHQNYGQHPSAYDYARSPHMPPARSNSKSVAALILGIGAIVIPFIGFFLGVVGIIVSAISLKEIRVRGERGSGMAVAGLVCSIVGTVLYFVILALILIFAFAATDNNYDYNDYSNIIMEA